MATSMYYRWNSATVRKLAESTACADDRIGRALNFRCCSDTVSRSREEVVRSARVIMGGVCKIFGKAGGGGRS